MAAHDDEGAFRSLDGMVVLDLSIWGIGSLAALILAELGADVIKVEHPRGDPGRGLQLTVGDIDCRMDDGRNAFFEIFNRRKRGITLDFKAPGGREVLYELARQADVVIENFRPGVAERLEVDYGTLSGINPRLVYASATGYGPNGPDRHRPGLDYVGQARSAYMWSNGSEDDPPLLSTSSPADVMGGFMLAQGVLAGLVRRGVTARGCRVDTSHLGATMFLQFWSISIALFKGRDHWPRTGRGDASNPLWNHYRCADDEWIALGLLQPDRHWPSFCRIIGRPDLLEDPRFTDYDARRDNAKALTALLDEIFASQPVAHWQKTLSQDPDFVFERVQRIGDLTHDPQVIENGYLFEHDLRGLGPTWFMHLPLHIEGSIGSGGGPAPALGEHTLEVLTEMLGYTDDQVAELAAQGAI